jgi:hypothetical protein
MVHPDFHSFMEKLVLPHKASNPSQLRLDGQTSGSSRAIFGKFRHFGKVWEVHEDTRFEPLIIAFEAMRRGGEPFEMESTSTNKRVCLVLHRKLKHLLGSSRFKYLYVYSRKD